MSDRDALKIFSRQPVTQEMISFLAATTSSIIQVKATKLKYSMINSLSITPVTSIPLVIFIKKLIKYSNVQTPTLMATIIYLNKLRNLLPANAVGMETTRHRIFLSALILSAKSLNDSSPLNKHWTKYTDGLLSIEEVNMAERELLGLLKWKVAIREDELIIALQPFLSTIKLSLSKKIEQENNEKINYYRLSNRVCLGTDSSSSYRPTVSRTISSNSLKSISTNSSRSSSYMSLSSYNSQFSLSNSSLSNYNLSTIYQEGEDVKKLPLSSKSSNSLNLTRKFKEKKNDFDFDNSVVNLVTSGRVIH